MAFIGVLSLYLFLNKGLGLRLGQSLEKIDTVEVQGYLWALSTKDAYSTPFIPLR